MLEKKELRKYIRSLKKKIPEEEYARQDHIINQKLAVTEEFVNAQNVLLYWSMDDEVSTHDFILKYYQKKNIYLPVIKGDDLDIVLFSGKSCLVEGPKYGIPEPSGDKLNDEKLIDLVVVPGVAFDMEGNRMGRGAGYYDRILKRVQQAARVALAYSFQMIEKVPVEPHDIKMDRVIYPK